MTVKRGEESESTISKDPRLAQAAFDTEFRDVFLDTPDLFVRMVHGESTEVYESEARAASNEELNQLKEWAVRRMPDTFGEPTEALRLLVKEIENVFNERNQEDEGFKI